MEDLASSEKRNNYFAFGIVHCCITTSNSYMLVAYHPHMQVSSIFTLYYF